MKNAETYCFPAVLEKYGNAWSVFFPDLPGCVATGENPEEAMRNAREGAELHLWGMELDGESIPAPAAFDPATLTRSQALCYVDISMARVRAKMDNRSVKKTLTIPWYLNDLGEKNHVNFSHLLQTALREKFGV